MIFKNIWLVIKFFIFSKMIKLVVFAEDRSASVTNLTDLIQKTGSFLLPEYEVSLFSLISGQKQKYPIDQNLTP